MTRDTRKSSAPPPAAAALATTDSGSLDSPRVRVAAYVATVVITLALLALVAVMSGWPLMWAADNFTDANVLMAGENFATQGFWKLHFLPVHYLTPSADCPVYYYLHYPPLDAWINGALRSLGLHSVYAMRLICGVLFIAGLLAMYRAFMPFIGPLAAVCGLAVVGTGGFFVGYATSLHHSYNFLFLGLFLLFFLAFTRSDRPARRLWWGAWVALLLGCLVSYEFILYTQIFAWVYLIGTGQIRRHGKTVLLLATAPLLAVGLHLLQNCWAVGLSAVRADGLGYSAYMEKGRWYWLKQLPLAITARSSQRYFWPLPTLLLAAVLLIRSERSAPDAQACRPIGSLLLPAFLAPLGWYAFMPRHAMIHPHTAGQLLPLVFVVMGCVAAWVLRGLFEPGQTRSTRVLAGLALLILIGGQYQAIAWRVEEWKSTVVEFIEALGPDALPPKTAVLHNTTTPHFACIVRRPAWRSLVGDGLYPFPECIPEVQRHLPPDWKLQYYLFFGSGDRDTFRLLARTCPGRRVAQMSGFPIVLFDISELHRPEAERRPLDPEIREKQMRGVFPEWQVWGFAERLERAMAKFPTPTPE